MKSIASLRLPLNDFVIDLLIWDIDSILAETAEYVVFLFIGAIFMRLRRLTVQFRFSRVSVSSWIV